MSEAKKLKVIETIIGAKVSDRLKIKLIGLIIYRGSDPDLVAERLEGLTMASASLDLLFCR